MRKLASFLIALILFAGISQAQTYTAGSDEQPIIGPLRSNYVPSGAGDGMILTADLDGAFIKSITTAGVATVQLADSSQATVTLALSGGLTEAEVQALVGAMFSSNTETGVTVTYRSSDQTIDVVVTALSFDSTIDGDGSTGDPYGIADGSVTAAKMDSGSAADGQVATADGSGGTAYETLPTGGGGMGLSSVESNSTLDGDGTTGDPLGIADDGVDTDQLADDAVTQAKLANNSVHAGQIGANAVDSSEIAANAVGTSELNDDAVTEAKIADSAVGHEQLAANSVRESEIQANAVGHSEMADAAVGVVELRDDAAERLCPDPSGGTSGQVCARNAAGDAYELVTQSGGGGGGTDDQTTSEVPVTATGFSGNLEWNGYGRADRA